MRRTAGPMVENPSEIHLPHWSIRRGESCIGNASGSTLFCEMGPPPIERRLTDAMSDRELLENFMATSYEVIKILSCHSSKLILLV